MQVVQIFPKGKWSPDLLCRSHHISLAFPLVYQRVMTIIFMFSKCFYNVQSIESKFAIMFIFALCYTIITSFVNSFEKYEKLIEMNSMWQSLQPHRCIVWQRRFSIQFAKVDHLQLFYPIRKSRSSAMAMYSVMRDIHDSWMEPVERGWVTLYIICHIYMQIFKSIDFRTMGHCSKRQLIWIFVVNGSLKMNYFYLYTLYMIVSCSKNRNIQTFQVAIGSASFRLITTFAGENISGHKYHCWRLLWRFLQPFFTENQKLLRNLKWRKQAISMG